jgi:hypothetical protein
LSVYTYLNTNNNLIKFNELKAHSHTHSSSSSLLTLTHTLFTLPHSLHHTPPHSSPLDMDQSTVGAEFSRPEKEVVKQQEKECNAAKETEKRKKKFQQTRRKLDNALCREVRYYQKEAATGKAHFKCPGAEQHAAWTESKCCSKCGKSKSLMVYKRNDCGGGNIIRGDGRRNRRPDCRVCYDRDIQGKNKAKACAKTLGISYKAPEGELCRLCSKPATKSNPLVFDHHHDLDKFRGYCCNRCNIAMGALGDNVSSHARVLKYMNETEGWTKEELISLIFN